MEIKVSAKDLDRITERLNAITKGLSERADKSIGRGAAMMQGAVKMLTPVDTGNLRNKIIITHPESYVYTVETNVEYAMFVEFGTGYLGDPRVSHTTKDSWVYFSDKFNGFRTGHPQKPVHMFTQGFADTYKSVVVIVDKEVKEILKNG